MQTIDAILLGLVQGLTEFLPVSSSAHLIVARELFRIPIEQPLAFDVLLHLATLLATITCFWGDIRRIFVDLMSNGWSARSKSLVLAIVVGSIPAGLVGFYYGDLIEEYLRYPVVIAWTLLIGSLVFYIADKLGRGSGGVSIGKGFVVGIFQSLALVPGVSRSGISISGGLLSGLSREEAVRFSFLLSIPAIAGAGAKVFLGAGLEVSEVLSLPHIAGFLTALIVGFLTLRFFVRYISHNNFNPFILYRLALALVILVSVW